MDRLAVSSATASRCRRAPHFWRSIRLDPLARVQGIKRKNQSPAWGTQFGAPIRKWLRWMSRN